MSRQPLWQISVTTSLEAEDAVVDLLARVMNRSVAVYSNEETKVTVASVYCQKRPEWTPARQQALRAGLKNIKAAGLTLGDGSILARRVAREDWKESWKRHFKPIEIGSRLLVKPSWIKRRSQKNQAVVVLDPGLSFGTGNHPTTSFCLHQLVKQRRAGQPQSFWDLGTGSGILAIAAAKLGYTRIRAIDFDPEALRVARANARQNRVLMQIKFSRADISQLPDHGRERYDLICANLISDLLLQQQKRILNRLHPGGVLVLAGILQKEFPQIEKSCQRAGLRLVEGRVEGEWQSGAFAFARD